MIDSICISAGGNKCLTFVGALNYLINKNIINLDNIKYYYGTSGGAIVCYFLVLGYSIEETQDFLSNFDFFECINANINSDNLLNNNGLNSGKRISYVIQQVLKNKLNVDDITLLDLYNLTKKEFVIIGTNYTKGVEQPFSYKTTPNISVITALRISTSIPFVFTPVLYKGDYYIDGGVTNYFPIDYCNQDTTIGLYIKFSIKNDLSGVLDMYFNCFNIIFDNNINKIIKNYKNIITIINTAELNKSFSDFDLDKEYLEMLIDLGYNCAKIHYMMT